MTGEWRALAFSRRYRKDISDSFNFNTTSRIPRQIHFRYIVERNNKYLRSMKVAVLILLCAREAALAAPNNFISSNQCQELSSILRSVRKGQQSVSTAINFLHDQKISAQGKACTGASCEGYDCCRCCCYSKCCSPQQWAKDLGIKASLSGVATKKRCTCANGTPAAGARCVGVFVL